MRSESRTDDSVAMLRDADIAMYEAKRNSRGSHQIFVPRMYEQTVERVRLEADMRVALDAGQLEVVYQPLVDLGDDRIIGVEALLRWHHPTRGDLMPTDFIPIAEACGEIRRIGLWVLEEACRTVGELERPSARQAPARQRERLPAAAAAVLRDGRHRRARADRLPAGPTGA